MRGLDLRRAGRSDAALELFRRAYESAPSPRTLGQMGLVESSLQLWTDADAHLTAALATPDDGWVHKNRQFLDQAMDRTQEHVGELVIIGPPGNQDRLGGKAIGALPISAPRSGSPKEMWPSAPRATDANPTRSTCPSRGRRAAISIVLDPIDLALRIRELRQPLVDRRPITEKDPACSSARRCDRRARGAGPWASSGSP